MNNLLISSGINKKKSSKVNWRTPQLVIILTKNGFLLLFRVSVSVVCVFCLLLNLWRLKSGAECLVVPGSPGRSG